MSPNRPAPMPSAPDTFMQRLRSPRLRRLQRLIFILIMLSTGLFYLMSRS